MKHLIVAAVAASTLLVSNAAFAKGPMSNGASDNANANACFGIGRADYMSNHDDGGSIIAGRAQADASDDSYANLNVELNDMYRMACQDAAAE